MNLAVDIGNTHTKIGLFDGNELKKIVLPGESLEQVLADSKIKHAILGKTGESDEVELLLKKTRIPTIVLSHQVKVPIGILYKTPHSLGADRIAGSAAAKSLFPENNVLKIDFGTCITYDFINNRNQYCGGAISPGMRMRFKALHHYTAQLPEVDPKNFNVFELTGTDTITSILSGVVNGIKEEVNGIIKDYDQRFGSLRVVATGGDAAFFVTLLKNEIFARPYLVLEGLNLILNYNIK